VHIEKVHRWKPDGLFIKLQTQHQLPGSDSRIVISYSEIIAHEGAVFDIFRLPSLAVMASQSPLIPES
ncbi:hypothetical protein J6590_099585, partial [Homalodisca vitripennis]